MTMTPVRPLFGRVVASLLIVSAALVSQGCPSPAVSIYRLAEADRPGRRRALAQLAAEGHRLHRNRAATWYTALFDGRSSASERQRRVARRPLPTDGELDWIELLLERQRGRRYPIESLWRRVASPGPYQDLAFRLLARRLRETTPYTRDDPGVAASRVLLERLRRLRPTRAWSPLAVDQRLRSIAWLQRRIRGRVDHPRRPLRLRVDRRPQSALRLRDLDLRWFSVGRREDLVAREIPGGRLHFGRSGVYRLELVRPRGIGAAWLRIETPFPLRIRHRSQETAIDPSRDGPLRFLELDRGPDDAPIRIVVGASNEPRPLILRWIAIPNEAADRRKRGRHRSHSSPPGIGFRVVSDTPALVQRRPRCGGDDDSRRLWLDGWRALVLGRNHDAQRCLHTLSLRLPSNPGVLAMLAEALLGDTSYPRSRREQSAVSLLENALQRDGAAMRAAMLLSRLADRRGLDERALRRLDALPKRERQRAPIVLARVAMLSEKGRVVEARAALERALQRFPHDCRIAVAIVRLWREQRDVLPMSTWVVAGTRLKRWLGATTTCRTLETELARSDEQSGHDERAIERYRRLLTVDPGDDATRLQLARLLLRTGQRQPAERELRRLARSRPRLELVHWLLAASRLGRGGTPHRRRERLDLLRRFAFLGAPLFPGIAIDDGRRLLARFLADRAAVARTNDRGAVIILRRRVSRLLGSGDEIRLDHVVVRVQDRSSLEQLGELHVPAGAELWRVRTLKANGRVLEIENSDDKEAISLPGLAIGDAIEYAYITFSRQTPRLFGEVDGERFYLQHQSLPTVEARYDLIVDDPAMAKRLRWDVRGPGREPQRHQTHGVRHFSWRATDLAPLDPEPDAPPTDDELRQVRVTTLTQIDALRRQL
ncbi:MAG: tetratricopeptide repeat protein, partial [Myxococcales bacterium]|nr:tetratricopeptide repeat protein [Myxococcales bacterium]